MPVDHLSTNAHYMIVVSTPQQRLLSIHVQAFSDGHVERVLFLRDEEKVDEAYEALSQAHGLAYMDKKYMDPAQYDRFWIWDWDLAEWVKGLTDEPDPTTGKDVPF